MMRFFLIVCIALSAQVRAEAVVELRPETQRAGIYDKIWFLLDDTGAMTLEEARAASGLFQRNSRDGLYFGDAGPVIWLRVDVKNTGQRDGEWLFATRGTNLEILDIYLEKNGQTRLLFTTADRKAAKDMLQRYFGLAAAFSLDAGEAGTLYARYRGLKTSRLPLSISSFEAASAARMDRYLINSVIAATVAALVLYSTAIFSIISGRIIIYYAISEFAMVLIILESNGLLSVHLWPETIFLQKTGIGILNAIHVIFTILFTRHFFRLPERAPRTDFCMQIWMGIALIYLVSTAVLNQYAPFTNNHLFAGYALLTPLWVALPLLAALATLRWDIQYWPLIPGWGIVVAGHLYWVLILRGMVPEPPFHPQMLGFIAVANAFFLSIAIVFQVRRLRDEKLHAQLDLNAALQRQLAAANQNAEILRELAAQDRLVHAAGHDSRSILLGLRSFAAGLQGGTNTPQVGVAARAITHLTDDLEAVLSTTIASAAHYGGENVLALESAPLKQIIAAVRLIHERAIRDKGLRFSVHPGEHELVTDRPLLARILGNLVENALKYTKTGGIVMAARRHGGSLRIQVWDSGCGIAPEMLTALLDVRIGQMRVSGSAAGQGTGLYTAKALAARIGATIAACSRPGHGSVFELRIPLTPLISKWKGADAQRLWILENSYDMALRYSAMADELGLTAKCTLPSMQEALFERSGLRNTDLVLIDYNFGGVNRGLALAHQLATIIPPANIFLKTYDRGVDVRAAVSGSAGVILYEPVTREALWMAIYSPKPSTSAIE
jgi:two-component system, sensor histidine kinase LadS